MKYLYIIFLFLSFGAQATNYYISNAGSDGANGLTPATSWATIAKVNAQTFSPGDSILFNAGDSWNERLNVPSSGVMGNHIIFAVYGTGSKPVITGLQTQGGFTNVGSIWTTTATNSVKRLNTVLIGGTIQAMARTPNTGYNTFSSFSSNTQITTSLTGTPNYTGGHIVVRSASWVLDRTNISSQSGGVLNLSPGLTYTPNLGGNGYFLQNNVSDLDVQNEWTFDSTTKTLKVFSSGSPSVQISTIDTLVNIKKKNYITFYGLSFMGANVATFQVDSSRYILIKNCKANYSGYQCVIGRFSQHVILKNDSILNSLSNGIYMREAVTDPTVSDDMCDSTKLDSLYIHNTGALPGMGQLQGTGENGNFQYFAINVNGNDDTITNCTIDSSGYLPLFFNGKRNIIEYNFNKYYCYIKDDGGGIYTAVGGLPANADTASIIRHNIVIHGIGAGTGTTNGNQAVGIYLDNVTMGVKVDSNTQYDAQFGMLYNGSVNCQAYDNTVVDSNGTVFNLSTFAGTPSGNTIKRNILYSQNASNQVMYFQATDLTESVDSNYYLRPLNESTSLRMAGTTYNLSSWQSATGYDTHGHITPGGITSNVGTLYYNPTHTPQTIFISGNWLDAKGLLYVGQASVPAFGSLLLFPTTTSPFIYNIRYNRVK